jgi:hypothetical protein
MKLAKTCLREQAASLRKRAILLDEEPKNTDNCKHILLWMYISFPILPRPRKIRLFNSVLSFGSVSRLMRVKCTTGFTITNETDRDLSSAGLKYLQSYYCHLEARLSCKHHNIALICTTSHSVCTTNCPLHFPFFAQAALPSTLCKCASTWSWLM